MVFSPCDTMAFELRVRLARSNQGSCAALPHKAVPAALDDSLDKTSIVEPRFHYFLATQSETKTWACSATSFPPIHTE
jgi:hypothetical protein